MKKSPEFIVAKTMPFGTRVAWIVGLAALGIFIQITFSLLLGLVFVFAGVFFGMLAQKSNEPPLRGVSEWQTTTIEEFQEASSLTQETEELQRKVEPFNYSATGCASLLFVLFLVGAAGAIIYSAVDQQLPPTFYFTPLLRGGPLSTLFVIDALVMILPLWLAGKVVIWEPPQLEMRLDQLVYIYNNNRTNAELEFQPSLQVAKGTSGSVPQDCKLMAKIKDADPNFMGIQIQTSLNDVQGTKYPYTYCVLIAKPEFKLMQRSAQFASPPPNVGLFGGMFADANKKKEAIYQRYGEAILEVKNQGEVDIAVVRQDTGTAMGYRTSLDEAEYVFQCALNLATSLLGKITPR